MLCQLELLTRLTRFPVPDYEILPSRCSVCERHLGQNFLIENLSVCVFLFLLVV